ncbi:MAG: 2Fe-2S iron-sulfur cluster-binding protein [Thermoanaerobaculia bacterium]
MSGSFRLPRGGTIDRSRPLAFRFDGRKLSGFAGDTLASALLANGVDVLARSFKERRPRGVLSAGPEETHALVAVGEGPRRTPSVRATLEPLVDGLVAESQHGWPSVGFDLGAIMGWLHPFLPAGFYNKTFTWPSWELYEPVIRRLAGLGATPRVADGERYAWRNAHCDLLVVGAGAAGLVAAWVAARGGARVIVVESAERPGGGLRFRREDLGGGRPQAWVDSMLALLGEHPGVRLLTSTTAVGAYDHGVFAALERCAEAGGDGGPWAQRWWRIRTRGAILASGAIEQPLVFPYNDRPGIVLADAARHYLHSFAVAVGRRVLVATNNDSAYRVALDLAAAGIEVPGVVDARPAVRADLRAALEAAGIPVEAGARIERTRGRRRVAAARFVASGAGRWVECDAIAMSGGWNPAAQLYGQAGGRLRFDAHSACLVPDGALAGMRAAGAAAGRFELRAALDQAAAVAAEALAELGRSVTIDPSPWRAIAAEPPPAPVGPLGCASATRRDRAWVDFGHDVTAADLDLAVRENFVSVEHLKRYTTVGMAFDQGKTSNLNALAILAERTGRPIAEVGTTKFRPPVIPVTLGAIAGGRLGAFLRPARLLPSHDRQIAAGARFEDYGLWRRPATYPRPGESEPETIAREVTTVRTAAGLFEASPLGKIRVRGADAGELLERVYAQRVADLAPGQVRYAVMLTEKGVVMDDGVCARVAEDEFWVGTSSANAARIAAWLEEWLQCQWPELAAVTTDVTSQWATLTVAGPRARDVLRALPCDVDLAPRAFPHSRFRDGEIAGVPCRIFRVSFTGELSYEINVPADRGAALWDALVAAGAPHGLTPIGVEAWLVLRMEKGYLHLGADTDGTTVPDDLGLSPALARKSGDFVGRRSLALPENLRPDRLQLVGLRCRGESAPFVAGGLLVDGERVAPPVEPAGYLTSAAYSPTLGAHLGLGMLRRGRARHGERVTVVDGRRSTIAEVVPPAHYDPTGERLRG